jgi:hypothetical protein
MLDDSWGVQQEQAQMISRVVACLFGAAVAAGLGGSASAAGGVKAGVLICNVDAGMGYVIGSSKGLDCVFSPTHRKWRDHYVGSITKFGADIGVTTAGRIMWAGFAPGSLKRGSLAGSYFGATGEATAGIGVGANVLLGGFQSSINLQAVSLSTQTGVNVAGGIASLSLRRH